ncbi:MBL fold metallo-hydrolase [Bacillus sp. Marseille-P3661]|uniref:MBL fold metallo-hydrolase n=1 Tax=Bacillus sp. Marseille-P3661 TaxID=1936234 RepID=UPI000C849F42|nr:MBL fold metallo-hydrolase [Bacillus sp. Marseille-P3661]
MKYLKKEDCTVLPIIVPVKSILKTVNFFLVKRAQSLTLIDAGFNNEDCWNALNATLMENDHSLKDITEIILTHHHIDHVGLVNKIVSNHPLPVYASPHSIPRLKRDRTFLEMRIDFYANLYREHGCGEEGKKKVDSLRQANRENQNQALEADIIELKHTSILHFNIIDTPGHAPDQLAFWDQNSRWLFTGDLLLGHISSNALVEPDYEGKKILTLNQHLESLKRCAVLNAEIVFPGHGELIYNANELIQMKLERTEQKCEKLLQLIGSGISTANDLAMAYYNRIYHEQFSLVMSEVIGHLDYMELNNRVNKEFVQGLWHYST